MIQGLLINQSTPDWLGWVVRKPSVLRLEIIHSAPKLRSLCLFKYFTYWAIFLVIFRCIRGMMLWGWWRWQQFEGNETLFIVLVFGTTRKNPLSANCEWVLSGTRKEAPIGNILLEHLLTHAQPSHFIPPSEIVKEHSMFKVVKSLHPDEL